MQITTERLILRPWKHGKKHEAESLFRYASDPEIGIRCGWMPHRSVAESMNTLDNVFTGDENYAITLRGDGNGTADGAQQTDNGIADKAGKRSTSDADNEEHRNRHGNLDTDITTDQVIDKAADAKPGDDSPIGAIELKKAEPGDHAGEFVREAIDAHALFEGVDPAPLERALAHYDGDRVLGYWVGRPFWGQGLMTEALRAMLRHAFVDLGCNAVWGGHYAENPASGKVMEHCGMRAVCRKDNDYFPLIDRHYDAILRVITKEEWERG
ncbi:GNAT family N-acetyltransferase [Bifidobacterium sp. ESL0764]|uniref:GNAT family N-acetyltransferase n=1 Tax=Bifidobacterium sp. ESL0764 TaxID=2983228 RepID=UPI0023FA49B6|nr:GNAT family N-acetyltransferase [Bifidobacterium sp. ESL0764]WEV65483.1 GNAT family N-acetyltransferase [Bifidobacterium sp. ESL0764]